MTEDSWVWLANTVIITLGALAVGYILGWSRAADTKRQIDEIKGEK